MPNSNNAGFRQKAVQDELKEIEMKKKAARAARHQEISRLKELKKRIQFLLDENNHIYYETRRGGYLGKRIEWANDKSRRGHPEVEKDLTDHWRIEGKFHQKLKKNQGELAKLVPQFEESLAKLKKR